MSVVVADAFKLCEIILVLLLSYSFARISFKTQTVCFVSEEFFSLLFLDGCALDKGETRVSKTLLNFSKRNVFFFDQTIKKKKKHQQRAHK